MSRPALLGQLFMVGVRAGGPSPAVLRALGEQHVGSVVVLDNRTSGVKAVRTLTDRLRAAAGSSAGVRLLVATDQEGGSVQRLQGPGFDRIPSAEDQAALPDGVLAARAERWGDQLRGAGVDADLAPVADVVPVSVGERNAPIKQLRRGYGSDPAVVAQKAAAVTRGLSRAGVITSVKHFPGLGRVQGNTDVTAGVTDDVTTRRDPLLAGFRASLAAGADMVMVSSATYPRIDPDHLAAFSPVVIGQLIRDDLGFGGVVISDDLAAQALSPFPPGTRADRFLAAGGDLVVAGQSWLVAPVLAELATRAAHDPQFAASLVQHATRVLAMKARHGLASCRP